MTSHASCRMPHTQIALIGGIYSNYHALLATLDDIARRGADATYFLGDLGAFGPHPDRIPELLIERGIAGIQGNYEESLASGRADCTAAPRARLMDVSAVAVAGRGLIDPHEPVFRADDEALLRGRSVFETLRAYGGRPFRLDQHLARFAASYQRVSLALHIARRVSASPLR